MASDSIYPDGTPTVYKVKDLSPDDQPRERAQRYGVGSLSVADLFALILRTGIPGVTVMDMCRNMMRMSGGSLHALERKTQKDIEKVPGMGEVKALQVLAVMELIRRYAAEGPTPETKIVSSDSIYQIMRYVNGNLDHEEMWALFLDRANIVRHKYCVTSGSATATVFDTKGVLKEALLHRAEAIVLCHNHPSGTLRPSIEDDSITRRFKEACNTVEIRFLDHLIVTPHGYYSYQNESRIL